MKQVRKISLVVSIFLIISCSRNDNADLEILAKTYTEILVVEDYYSNSDSLDIKRQEIFDKYSITEEVYDSTFARFKYDREKWEEFFKLASAHLDTLKSEFRHPEKP